MSIMKYSDKNQKYDIVLVDADETLFDFKKAEHDALKMTLESLGVEFTEERFQIYSTINVSYWKKLEKGEVTREELKKMRYEDFFERIGVKGIDCVKINDTYLKNLSTCSSLIPGALDFIKKLSEYCRIIIITNGLVVSQTGRFRKSGLAPYVDNMYISEEVGYQKPDKEYFDYVFEKENITDIKRVIVLGDSLTSDMLGGRNAGVDTCRYVRDGVYGYSELCDYVITDYDEFFDILFSN